MTDAEFHYWPETLTLDRMHQSEIVGWMQDKTGEPDAGKYIRADLTFTQADIDAAVMAERDRRMTEGGRG
ncbi:hypothetical protein [Pseudorhodobacter sp.]|uniref:hypothetical protein n=1 Tax=Pseudorhodobacter sp. TaxID=1934400 RepID=UPI002649F88E|nr:hypothetical protein [Pseudorhodobacter sp.]MDN5786514.1 hypothetical protein [Pseudorhodobacter sp.]